jgi:MFS family permease
MGSSEATPRLRGIYYGWWIVAAWVVLNVYWAGTLLYGLTVFFTPVRQTFGWSAALTASVFSLPNLLSGLLAPFSGAWFDRSGPRPLMLVACMFGAAGLLAIGRTTSLVPFVAAFAVISVGYGIWSGTGIATAGLWFTRRSGLATGIVVAGSALGGVLVPFWQIAINHVGWRDTVTLAGLGMLAIGVPASMVLRTAPPRSACYQMGADRSRNRPIPSCPSRRLKLSLVGRKPMATMAFGLPSARGSSGRSRRSHRPSSPAAARPPCFCCRVCVRRASGRMSPLR